MQSQRDTTKEYCKQWNTLLQCYIDCDYILTDASLNVLTSESISPDTKDVMLSQTEFLSKT